MGGALDRAITPHGGSRLAASTDADDPYPKLNFFFPIVALRGRLPAAVDPRSRTGSACSATGGRARRSCSSPTRSSPARAACSGSARSRSPASAPSPPAQFATDHGWPILLAMVVGGVDRRGARAGHRPAHDPARQPLRRAGRRSPSGCSWNASCSPCETFAQFGVGVAVARPEFASTDKAFTYLALAVFAVFAILIVNLRRSTTGLALNAVRWSETASRTMGLSVIQMKMLVSRPGRVRRRCRRRPLRDAAQAGRCPLDYATLLGLVWLAVLVTFGVRSNIAALLAGMRLRDRRRRCSTRYTRRATWAQLPVLLLRSRCDRAGQEPRGHGAHVGHGVPAGCCTSSAARARCPRRPRSPAATIRGCHPERRRRRPAQNPTDDDRGGRGRREPVDADRHPPVATGDHVPALEARNVTVRFGGLVALSDVSLRGPAGHASSASSDPTAPARPRCSA